MQASDVADRIGVGLWTMQSTARRPHSATGLYRRFAEDAAVVDRHGLHSVWTAEHRFWYDGWCPALLHAQAYAAVRTVRVRFSNAMLLLPQHDPTAFARAAATLDRLTGGRVELGLGLGHRDAEFDGMALRRDRRGRLMDEALDRLAAVWRGELGDAPPVQTPGPPIWIGGMAPAAIARAARHGHHLMLPQTLDPSRYGEVAERYAADAGFPPVIGTLRDAWIDADPRRRAAFRARLRDHYAEEVGSWWVVKGEVGFRPPERVVRQLDLVEDAAIVGGPDEVAAELGRLFASGVSFVVVRLNFDFVERDALHEQVARLAEDVVPAVAGAAVA